MVRTLSTNRTCVQIDQVYDASAYLQWHWYSRKFTWNLWNEQFIQRTALAWRSLNDSQLRCCRMIQKYIYFPFDDENDPIPLFTTFGASLANFSIFNKFTWCSGSLAQRRRGTQRVLRHCVGSHSAHYSNRRNENVILSISIFQFNFSRSTTLSITYHTAN